MLQVCCNKLTNKLFWYLAALFAMGQTTRPTQPSIPFGVDKRVVIYIITWTTAVETIKRQIRAAYGCLDAGQSLMAAGLSLQTIGCTSVLVCDVQRHCSCSCCLWRYISVMPLPFSHRKLL